MVIFEFSNKTIKHKNLKKPNDGHNKHTESGTFLQFLVGIIKIILLV